MLFQTVRSMPCNALLYILDKLDSSLQYIRWQMSRQSSRLPDGGSKASVERSCRQQISSTKAVQYATTKTDVMELNVGGIHFLTTRATLSRFPDSMLAKLFSGRYALPTDVEGRIVLDRDPKYFAILLDFLRNPSFNYGFEFVQKISLNDAMFVGMLELEFDYFLIPWQHPKSLYTLLQDPLSFRMENHTDSTSPVTIATCQSGDDSQVWLIAVGHRNGAVHLWTTDIQGRYEYHHSLLDNTSAISAIAVTSRQYMVAGTTTGSCFVWNKVKLGIAHYNLILDGRSVTTVGATNMFYGALCSSEPAFISSCEVRIWHQETHHLAHTIAIASSTTFSMMNEHFLVANAVENDRICKWNLLLGTVESSIELPFTAHRICVDSYDHRIATSNYGGSAVAIWNEENHDLKVVQMPHKFGLRACENDTLVGVNLEQGNVMLLSMLDIGSPVQLPKAQWGSVFQIAVCGPWHIVTLAQECDFVRLWRPVQMPSWS